MERSGMRGATPRTKKVLPATVLTLGLAVLTLLGGCSSTTPSTTKGNDPLLGDSPPIPKGPPGTPGTPTGLSKPSPPPPGAPRGTTPASLVGNTEIPGLTGAKPLAIDGWKRDLSTPPGGPRVIPVPLEKSAPPPGLLTTGAWSTKDAPLLPVGGNPLARLESAGARGVRQEVVPGGVQLSCFVPGGTTPGGLLRLETTAPDLPTAVEAILQQMAIR